MKYKSILFDLDGTISDSLLGIEKGIFIALEKCDVTDVNPKTVKQMIGMPLSKSLSKYFFGNDDAKIDKAIFHFREYYSKTGLFESKLYPGIKTLIQDLNKSVDLYIVTAKPTDLAVKVLQHHQIYSSFTKILGLEPHEISFEKSALIKSLNLKESAVMIGDKKQDIDAGKKTHISTIGVLYGYGSENEIKDSKPDFIASSVNELRNLLL